MQKYPVLAARTIPAGNGYKVARTFRVEGGLHYIESNKKPYFSLTYTAYRKGFPNQCYSGGAGHNEILKYYPRFADLAALHLSDIDGIPMHAEANGWYYLAGALGGTGEKYHAGNSERNFPIEPPADKPWKNTEYRKPTQDECVQLFANHIRVDRQEAELIIARCKAATLPNAWEQRVHPRDIWKRYMESLLPKWKAEAGACIAKHNLKVFGDAWEFAA